MNSPNIIFHKKSAGFSIIELMTVLVIIMLLAMIGFPTYQDYQNRTNLAEAESIIGTMERHLRTYFLDHGSFYSASPQPASVPGLVSLGDPSSFTPVGGWTTIGSPVGSGSNVNFSYQAFAGKTLAGSTTPVENDYLFNPTDDMNLVRRVAAASSNHFLNPVRLAQVEEKLHLDFADVSFCANAAPQESTYDACVRACRGNNDCITACRSTSDIVDECTTGCMAEDNRRPEEGCRTRCEAPANGQCTSGYDIDCYTTDRNGARLPRTGEACASLDVMGFCPANDGGEINDGGGGPPPDDEGETDDGEYSGGGGDDEGETDEGQESGDDNESVEGSNSECSPFGINRPVDFGVEQNLENYNWVVMTAVGSFTAGTECTLVAKVLKSLDASQPQHTESIKLNVGE